jgi:hypothetical protein
VAAGDLTGHDPHADFALAAGPRPDCGVLLQAAQLSRVRDAVGRPAHQHAPALAEGLVDVVDLEGGLLVGVPVDDRALGHPDHDGAGQHGEVDRHHDRARGRAERDPPDAAGRDRPAAFGRHQLADEPHVG